MKMNHDLSNHNEMLCLRNVRASISSHPASISSGMCSVRSHDWVGWFACDSAVVSIVTDHLDVTSGSPSGSPGVLDQEVVPTSFASVSDSKDGVVQTAG